MLKNFATSSRLVRDTRKFSRHSHECRAKVRDKIRKTVARNSHASEILAKRHSYECRATLARMSRDCRTNLNENKLHSRESRETLSRLSRDCRTTVARLPRDIFSKLDRNSRICRINVYSMRLQRESCVYIVYICREIVANYSRTSLQLSHSSEIGALDIHFVNQLWDPVR